MGVPVWLLVGTHYTITESTLIVRSGPFKWEVQLKSISSIEPSRSILSSPALSFDRLEIKYGNNQSILISPTDQNEFLQAISAKDDHVTND